MLLQCTCPLRNADTKKCRQCLHELKLNDRQNQFSLAKLRLQYIKIG